MFELAFVLVATAGCVRGAAATRTPGPAPIAITPAPQPVPAPVAADPEPDESATPDDTGDPHMTPPEVEREIKHMSETYRQLTPLRRLPDFLSVDAVLALMPDAHERNDLRNEIHGQLEGHGGWTLLGDYLDEGQERLFVLWLGGYPTQVLAVYEGGRLTGKSVIWAGRPMLGDVLSEADGSRPEILIERVTSKSDCCWPWTLDVMRVSKRGVLTRVLTFPRGQAEARPVIRWNSFNHFEFAGDRVQISSVYPGGPTYELVFDKGTGRFEPTPATRKLLAAERREGEKPKD